MKKSIISFWALFLIAFAAYSQNVRIYTGVKDCGSYEIGKDLEKVLNGKLEIVETEGSLDNLDQLKPGEIAITQFDALQEQLLKSIMGLAEPTDSFRILIPLGKTEIHLLTMSENISTLKDLSGKRVSIGLPPQGTHVTALNIKKLTDIQWVDVEMGLQESIAALFAGQVDAMFYVAAAPVSQFSKFSMLPSLKQKQLKIVPIFDNRLSDEYSPIRINAGTYTWATTDVNTYAVETIMVVDKTGQTSSQIANYTAVLSSIKENLLELQKSGKSAQWSKVVYNFKVLGEWKMHSTTEAVFFPGGDKD